MPDTNTVVISGSASRVKNFKGKVGVFSIESNSEADGRTQRGFFDVKCFGEVAKLIESKVVNGSKVTVTGFLKAEGPKERSDDKTWKTIIVATKIEGSKNVPSVRPTSVSNVRDSRGNGRVEAVEEEDDQEIPFSKA